KLARKGKDVTLPPREVTVHSIELLSCEHPHLRIDVRCEGGTYIRALGRDIGELLKTGGYCSALTRTEVGTFHLDTAISPDELDPQRDLLSPLIALEDLAKIVIDEQQVRRLVHGNPITAKLQVTSDEVAILDTKGELLAIARVADDQGTLQPVKVFVQS
ncbi:MAG: tRNA pseudouridine(55) synthase TruB, partial [Planctomycetota bacterium]